MTVTVYSTPNCQGCKATYRRLHQRQVDYTVVDITENTDKRQFVVNLGHSTAPVVVVTDKDDNIVEHWSGFNPGKLDKLA